MSVEMDLLVEFVSFIHGILVFPDIKSTHVTNGFPGLGLDASFDLCQLLAFIDEFLDCVDLLSPEICLIDGQGSRSLFMGIFTGWTFDCCLKFIDIKNPSLIN